MDKIIQWFNRPYPSLENNEERLSLSLITGVIVSLVLLIFQPLGIRDQNAIVFLTIIGFGSVTTICTLTLIYLTVFLQFFKIIEERWSVGKQFVFTVILIAFIALGNWGLSKSISEVTNSKYFSLGDFISITLAVGIFPLLTSIFYSEKKLRQRNDSTAEQLNREISTESTESTPNLPVKSNSFIYAKTEGNYIQIFSTSEEPQLLRMTMRELESNYGAESHIIRCHRSYMTNLGSVISVKGNASGLILSLNGDLEIPVSRSYVDSVKALLLHKV